MPTSRTLRSVALASALACLTLPATALYKVVGPDGSVTYTDRPPGNTAARVTSINRDGQAAPSAQDTLPQDLRLAAMRFPVTLYVAANCPPCDAGRQLLEQRGVPFVERQIASDDDAIALERVIGARTVPSLTIGSQGLRGLSQTDWNAYLDAAGYPRESRLPASWQAPVATPLAARNPARAASAAASAPVPAVAPPAAPTKATTGLRF